MGNTSRAKSTCFRSPTSSAAAFCISAPRQQNHRKNGRKTADSPMIGIPRSMATAETRRTQRRERESNKGEHRQGRRSVRLGGGKARSGYGLPPSIRADFARKCKRLIVVRSSLAALGRLEARTTSLTRKAHYQPIQVSPSPGTARGRRPRRARGRRSASARWRRPGRT